MIQHVTRTVPPDRAEECVLFYRLLGFVSKAAPPGVAERAVWLQLGPTQLHLMLDPEARPERGHIGIVTDDYGATVDALQSAGHPVEARRAHWGARRSYVRDPVGNLVELMEHPPA